MSALVPLSLRPSRATRRTNNQSISARTPIKSPRGRSSTSPRSVNGIPQSVSKHPPPKQRLTTALQECIRLDQELKVIENSGHVKLGVFAKSLGNQQRCKLIASAAKNDANEHLPDDPVPESSVEDDDITVDPLYHRFYDEQGLSLYEQLLRTRMRVLALAKLAHGRGSVEHVRACIELADTYARMNLWKQAHHHIMTAHDLLKQLDTTMTAKQLALNQQLSARQSDEDPTSNAYLAYVLEYWYDKQLYGNPSGNVTVHDMVTHLSKWRIATTSTAPLAISKVFSLENLQSLFGSTSSLHWQQLVIRLERQSPIYQDHSRETLLSMPEQTARVLEQTFTRLDPSKFGVVPVFTLIRELESNHDNDLSLVYVCQGLHRHYERIKYPSITWSEILELSWSALHSRSLAVDPARELRPRLKSFFGRFFLRKGQPEDALRYLHVAVAEEELLHNTNNPNNSGSSLVSVYLVLGQALALRFKQLAGLAQHHAFEVATKWLQSTEGSRRLRSKALEIIDEVATRDNIIKSKKDAESQARDMLLKEYAALSFVQPDTTMVDDAVEYCTKAWTLQEEIVGREHVTTAMVHVSLAQIYAIKNDWNESIRCYEKAIEIYESSCHGPVPASILLRLEIAKIFHHHFDHQTHWTAAATAYQVVGTFFHSFALEFASSDSTRRDACVQAIEAWRQCLTAPKLYKKGLEDEQQIRQHIHDATVDGYGEFSFEAASSAKELAQYLVKIDQLHAAEHLMTNALYIFESHFGPNDRRCRKTKKELLELVCERKAATRIKTDVDDNDDWLRL